jgi:hypothetical protein
MILSSGKISWVRSVIAFISAFICFIDFFDGLVRGKDFPVFGFFTTLIVKPRKLNPFLASTTLVFFSLRFNPTFAIRAKKRLFLGINRQETLDFQGVNFQNGL